MLGLVGIKTILPLAMATGPREGKMKPKRVTSLFTVLFFVTVITLSTNYKAAHISAASPADTFTTENKPASFQPIFLENVGQMSTQFQFQIWGAGQTILFTETEIWITQPAGAAQSENQALPTGTNSPDTPVKLSWVDANPTVTLEAFDQLETQVDYYSNEFADSLHVTIPAWHGIRYHDLYPGIDLEVVGENHFISFHIVCRQNCDHALKSVKMQVNGADILSPHGQNLFLSTAFGNLQIPLATVTVADGTSLSFQLSPVVQGNTVQFPFAKTNIYAGVATPASSYSTTTNYLYASFIGGSNSDQVNDIYVDESGRIYLVGNTRSLDFPNPFDPAPSGAGDIFVARFSDPATLERVLFIAGGTANAITESPAGHIYVTGSANKTNFPVTPGAHQSSCNWAFCTEVFVLRIEPFGLQLKFAALVGGNGYDYGYDIAADASGNAYVTGLNAYGDFPTTPSAFDRTYNGGQGTHNNGDAFVFKMDPTGANLLYSTYLGGVYSDGGNALAVDGSGYVYVTGATSSSNFPTTPGAYDRVCGTDGTCNITPGGISYGSPDVFVSKLSPNGDSLIYSTYIGHSKIETGNSIIVDAVGNVYVGGSTSSTFPTTYGSFDQTPNGEDDAFVLKLNAIGSNLLYSTLIGGTARDEITGIALANDGRLIAVGNTMSSNFPVSSDAFDPNFNGGSSYLGDSFLFVLDDNGSSREYATYLGGENDDGSSDVAIGPFDTVYLAGTTSSTNLPVTSDAFQENIGGYNDGYLARFRLKTCTVTSSDSCFRPAPDGYIFSNIKGVAPSDFTITDMQRMFGDIAVCQIGTSGDTCVPKRAAVKWVHEVNETISLGRCVGMAATTLRFFHGVGQPQSYYQPGASLTYELEKDNARKHITYYAVEQFALPVNLHTGLFVLPSAALEKVQDALTNASPVIVVMNSGTTGHAVTPYAVEDMGDGIWRILIYDNERPNESKYIEVNTNNQTWHYPEYNWGGNALTWSLYTIPLSEFDEPQTCLVCQLWAGSTETGADGSLLEVWLHGKAHALIQDADGHRLGFSGNDFVNEIDGASMQTPILGAFAESEPIYTLPITGTYSITVHGQTLTASEATSISQIGPGFVVGIDDIWITPAASDKITLATDGSLVRYQPSEAQEAVLFIAKDTANVSYEFEFAGVDIGATNPVSTSVNLPSGELVLNNKENEGGLYDLMIVRANTETRGFWHNDISLQATDTHYLDFAAWDGMGAITLQIDHGSDGTIDEIVSLENQPPTIYLPVIR